MYLNKVLDHAKKLGLPEGYCGFRWWSVVEIDEQLISKGLLDDKEREKELCKILMELQNYNKRNNLDVFNYFNKKKDENITKDEEVEEIAEEVEEIDEEVAEEPIEEIAEEVEEVAEEPIEEVAEEPLEEIAEESEEESEDKKRKIEDNVKENYENLDTVSIKVKKSKKENKNKIKDVEDIDDIMNEIRYMEDNNTLNTKDEIEAERREYLKSVKLLKKKVKNCVYDGVMDILQKDPKRRNNKILEYYLHLREEIYIQYHNERDIKFKIALSSTIQMNKTTFDNISKITGCEKIVYNDRFNYFKIWVKKEKNNKDLERLTKASMLIANYLGKYRENLNQGRLIFKKLAMAF